MFADFRVHGLNKMGDPDFLYGAPDMTAFAAFSKESRMRFANATKLHRKSGGSPSIFFSYKSGWTRWEKHWKKIVFNPCTRKSANMGHPSGEQGW